MGPGVDEQLGGKGGVLGQATAPRPTMDEDIDRRAGACGAVDVECLDRGRTVGIALWCTQVRTRDRAVAPVAGDELLAVRRPDALGIRGVKRGLVHVEPHPWPLLRCAWVMSDGSWRLHVVPPGDDAQRPTPATSPRVRQRSQRGVKAPCAGGAAKALQVSATME